jgi:hypothetical protein
VESTVEDRYPGTLPTTWLAVRWATDPARIESRRRSGELIAVRPPGSSEWRYPAWQFENGKPRPGIARIVTAAREAGVDDSRLYDLLTAPLGIGRGDRRRLCDLLLEGREDEVVAAVRSAGS